MAPTPGVATLGGEVARSLANGTEHGVAIIENNVDLLKSKLSRLLSRKAIEESANSLPPKGWHDEQLTDLRDPPVFSGANERPSHPMAEAIADLQNLHLGVIGS
jgi:hypothetical protein